MHFKKNSNGITDSTSLKFEYKRDVSTGDINHTKKNKHMPIISNGITIYTNKINVGHHRNKYSNELVTHNDITTIDIQKINRYQNNILSNLAKSSHQ